MTIPPNHRPPSTSYRAPAAVLTLSVLFLLCGCGIIKKLTKQEPAVDKDRVKQCQSSRSATETIDTATQLLANDYSTYTSRASLAKDLSVARSCASRALVLSPNNYGATMVLGVIALTEAKSTLFHRGLFEFFKKKQREKEAAEHLNKAKDLLGRAYVLRSGQLQPLFYLAEVSVLEENLEIATNFLGHLKQAHYRPLEVQELEARVDKLRKGGLGAKYRDRKAPSSPVPDPRRSQVGGGKKFRVGVLSFGQGSVEQALPAMLLTALQDTGRFQIFEGGGIRVDGQGLAALTETTARDLVDGYLSGTITKTSPTEICFEVRLANAMFHYVLYAESICSSVEESEEQMPMPRQDKLAALAQDIARSVKELQASAILAVDDTTVYVDAGASSGIVPGMVGYVLGTGSAVTSEDISNAVFEYTGAQKSPGFMGRNDGEFIVGSVYILSVDANYSTGVLYHEGLIASGKQPSHAIPGDMVYFK